MGGNHSLFHGIPHARHAGHAGRLAEHRRLAGQSPDRVQDFFVRHADKRPARFHDRFHALAEVAGMTDRDGIRQRIGVRRLQRLVILPGRQKWLTTGGLHSQNLGQSRHEPKFMHFHKPFPDPAHGAAVADGYHHPVRHFSLILLHQLIDQLDGYRLLSFDEVGIDRAIPVVPAKLGGGFHAQLPGLIIRSLHREHPSAEHQQLRYFRLRGPFRDENRRRQSRRGGKSGQ